MINDYPTRRQLREIRNWHGTFRELWDYIVELWHWPDWGVKFVHGTEQDKCDFLELHTGGWSGNESIIEALENSKSPFFFQFHTKWERGGHYYFQVGRNLWDVNTSAKKEVAE